MKKFTIALLTAIASLAATQTQAQYNQLWIPDTLSGTAFDLTIKDTFAQIMPGNQTITASINKDNFWGPTLIVNKWDVIHPTVHNQLADTTTLHWHGMHLPAIMDGGPHQTIPPFATWSPYWQIQNNAGTYWYHPHMHKETMHQLISGIGGLIIVHDSIESALNLPRTYGVDDIPLILSDRSFDAANQFVVKSFGDSQLTNGVQHAQYTVPAQVVRFRLLDAAIECTYELGFNDNRTFYVITSDGGLLDTPVAVTRLTIHEGERYEILVDFGGQAGTQADLIAYNTAVNIAADTAPPIFIVRDFNMLHLNIGLPTINPVSSIPDRLTTNTYYDVLDANTLRRVAISDSFVAVTTPDTTLSVLYAFLLNHHSFDLNYVDYKIPLNNIEVWELNSTSFISHPFHIHDVQFHILTINGVPPPAYQAGWKDDISVPANQKVRFITKFDDYSDSLHPYMFHCHIARHEDEGMMGQFVVGNSPAGIMNVAQNSKMKLYPNPARSILNFEMQDGIIITHATVINTAGQVMKEMDLDTSKAALDLSSLNKGPYFLRLTDRNGGAYIKSYLME